MPVLKKTITITPSTLARTGLRGFYNLGAIALGLWSHPFLTVIRLVQKSSFATYTAGLFTTLFLLWLAQIIKHPQSIGLIPRLAVFTQIAWVVGFVFIILLAIALFIPNQARLLFSASFLTLIPAFWLLVRSIWFNFTWSFVINLTFLTLTIFFGLLQIIFLYLWFRLIPKKSFASSLFFLFFTFGLAYLFKQILCLWF
ncbi:MAG: hypothetical protein GXP43_01280 [bacterium]|nr:hypothetical protein [bacterium]